MLNKSMDSKKAMKQKEYAKAFAIFVGVVMILSAFAGFVLRSGDPGQGSAESSIDRMNLADFQVTSRLVDQNFDSLSDALYLCPENTTLVYWIDLGASQNLTDAARTVLGSMYPPAAALRFGDSLYPGSQTKLLRCAAAFFNNTWAEFHMVKPFQIGYQGFVIPYNGYDIIPSSSANSIVVGKPIIFGAEPAIKQVLDVLGGGLYTDQLTYPLDEGSGDLQVAGLGSGSAANAAPLGGSYQEFYLGITAVDGGFDLKAMFLAPAGETEDRINDLSQRYGWQLDRQGEESSLRGRITPNQLSSALSDILAP
ncbi:MAG: hypothetical protein A4E45_01484 [Methanosaeta sp. PtaB.Bin039]|nr:MAG: hypothetical protein A4E45_01484 [Methanosaeta sp. PtaB.Bin039]OPY44260.1 MAG: hypothetical protein A4E47_01679 [Methanosaeta sp. PtaU1.Bin028]